MPEAPGWRRRAGGAGGLAGRPCDAATHPGATGYDPRGVRINGDPAGGWRGLRAPAHRVLELAPARRGRRLIGAVLLCLAATAAAPALAQAGKHSAAPRVVRLQSAQLRNRHIRAQLRHGHIVRHGPRLARLLAQRRARARAAIRGGGEISIAEAPWNVFLEAVFLVEVEENGKDVDLAVELLCSGSILEGAGQKLAEVLTAAHCHFNPYGAVAEEIPVEDFVVVAGTSDFQIPEAGEQVRRIARWTDHPYFEYVPHSTRAMPDDVAVLTLEQPFEAGPGAQAIGLSAQSTSLPDGTPVTLTGFGEQRDVPQENDGLLHTLGTELESSRACGGEASAIFLCASTPNGTLCPGDSGGGLTGPGSPASLVGLADTVQLINEVACVPGAGNGFADLAAPEIWQFVEGNPQPPRAPRGGHANVHGVPQTGHALTCEAGSWSGAPSFTYIFIDGEAAQVLQSGPSPVYQLGASDVGRTILCEVIVTNSGGTTTVRTGALPPIVAAGTPPPGGGPVSPGGSPASAGTPKIGVAGAQESRTLLLAASTISVEGTRALVKVRCRGRARCRGRLTLRASTGVHGKGSSHRVTLGSAGVSLKGGRSATVRITLSAAGARLIETSKGHLSASLSLVGIGPTAPRHARVTAVKLVQQARKSH